MKKLTVLLLALGMLFCLAACGGNGSNDPQDAPSAPDTGETSSTGTDSNPDASTEPEQSPDPTAAEETSVSTPIADITLPRIDTFFPDYGDATYTVHSEGDTVYAKIEREDPRLEISLYVKPLDASSKEPADASGVAAHLNERDFDFQPVTIGSYDAYVERHEFSNNFGVQDLYYLDYPTETGNVVLMFFCKHMYQEDTSQMKALEAATLEHLKVSAKTT